MSKPVQGVLPVPGLVQIRGHMWIDTRMGARITVAKFHYKFYEPDEGREIEPTPEKPAWVVQVSYCIGTFHHVYTIAYETQFVAEAQAAALASIINAGIQT